MSEFTIAVRLPGPTTILCDVVGTETVVQMKERIAAQASLDCECTALRHEGELLDEWRLVQEYPFEEMTEVEVVQDTQKIGTRRLLDLGWAGRTSSHLVNYVRRLHPQGTAEQDTEVHNVVDAMADANIIGSCAAELLLMTTCRGLVRSTKLILERGIAEIDVQPTGYNNHTALHHAAYFGQESVARLLLDFGADASIKNRFGETPLDHARAKAPSVVGLML
eukprot:TRINITY_DN11974_c0_g4_i1.p1 TRINITY_DN11974_c0_g4~~TRINITY_DN11974_c0_g4_i1.p1  ORF type:complete len:222 (+),score=32.96 TRINITY_DN11974_c0_g4_i1:90-755(+)